jgi:hypothetical protein
VSTRVKNILKWTLITLAALMLVIVLTVLFWLGPTVKWLGEFIGPRVLGSPVRIEKLSINPRNGLIHLSGFSIANRKNFSETNAVSLASLDIAVDMSSIFSRTVTVHQVSINSPRFTFEQASATDNIAEYLDSINAFIGYDPDAPPEPRDEKKEEKKRRKEAKRKRAREEKTARIVVVESLQLNELQFRLTHTDSPDLDMIIGLGRLSVSMTNGMVRLNDLQVNNPGRLESESLFELDEVSVRLDPDTIHYPPLSIPEIRIQSPHCYVEWARDASTVSELISIADSTRARVLQWPLPGKNQDAETQPLPPESGTGPENRNPPGLGRITIENTQFHLVNSVDTNLTIRARLESLEAGMDQGTAVFGRFAVSNPARLATPEVFSLAGIDLRFSPESLYSETFILEDIRFRQPYAYLEANPETDTVQEFIRLADALTKNLPDAGSAPAAPPADEPEAVPAKGGEAAPPVEFHHVQVDDLQLKLLNTVPTNAPTEPSMLAGIRSIEAAVSDGELRISGITIPNPAGFQATNLFSLGHIGIEIDPATVASDQLHIRRVLVDSPAFNLEQTDRAGNVAKLQKSLMPFMPDPAASPEAEPASDTADHDAAGPAPPAAPPVLLSELTVTNLAVQAILPQPASATNEHSRRPHIDLHSFNPRSQSKDKPGHEPESGPQRRPSLLAFDLLRIHPPEGTVSIANLRLANPEGYANRHLVKMEQFNLQFDPGSLAADTLLIEKILIDKPQVSFERKIATDNIKTFQETLERAFARRDETMDRAKEQNNIETGEEKKLIITLLRVDNGTVRAKISALPTATIPLPKIEMKDLGKEEGGASLGEISSRTFTAFYDSIIGVVASTTGIAGDALKSAGALTFDALGNMTGELGGLVGLESGKKSGEPKVKKEPRKKKKGTLLRRRTFRK